MMETRHPVVGLAKTALGAFIQLGLDAERLVACPFIAEDSADLVMWAAQAIKDADGRRLVVPATVGNLAITDQALGHTAAVIIVVGDADELLQNDIMPSDMTLDPNGHWQERVLDAEELNDILALAVSSSPEPQGAPEAPQAPIPALPTDPRLKGVPLHLRNRPPGAQRPPQARTDFVQADLPANPPTVTMTTVKQAPVEPVWGAEAIQESRDPLCQALAPFCAAGAPTFALAARYALGQLEVEAWFPVRRAAASRGVREPQLAALSQYRLAASKPNPKDSGVAAVLKP